MIGQITRFECSTLGFLRASMKVALAKEASRPTATLGRKSPNGARRQFAQMMAIRYRLAGSEDERVFGKLARRVQSRRARLQPIIHISDANPVVNTKETTPMNSNHSSGQTSRSTSSLDPESLGMAAKSTDKDIGFEHVRRDEDLHDLRRDIASLTETVTYLASQVSDQAAKTVRNMSQMVASQVGGAASGVVDTGSELASSARDHAKTFASELEGMARRNPLGTIAGALLVGVVIGMISRGRN
jgi:ElaB/YqjD/DUF883 family membrane-anchored ribosome-binding protein